MTASAENLLQTHQSLVPSVGIDDGFAYIKTAVYEGKVIKTARFRSKVSSGVSLYSASGESQNVYQVDDGKSFTVNDLISGAIDTRFADYPVSDVNRVLVHHALMNAGFGGKNVRLCTTLPPGHFFRRSGVNAKLIEAKMASLSKAVICPDGKQTANIYQQRVVAEATSAVLDYVISDSGQLVRQFDRPIAVVDIGGRTTDVAVVLPDLSVDQKRLRSEVIGVLDVIDIIRDEVIDDHGLDDADASGLDFDTILESGMVRLHGHESDMRDIRDRAVEVVGQQIIQMVKTKVASGASLETILFCGGGAKVMEQVIQQYPHGVVHPDPQFANARGALKSLVWS